MRENYGTTTIKDALPSAVYDADNTPAAVDCLGYNSVLVVLSIGAGGITFTGVNKIEFVLTHSDDGITYANVTTSDVVGPTVTSGIIHSLTAAHAASTVHKVGYIGQKRYLKLLADFSGVHGTGTPMAGVVVLGDALQTPAP